MNQSYGARSSDSRHIPTLTEPENRIDYNKAFPDTYEIKAWESWGDKGKLRILRKIAETYGRDPRLREHTIGMLRSSGVQPRDYPGMAAAILKYAQTKIYYINEPGEQVQSPWYTLRKGFGDCDDMAVYIASAAESIALPWRYCLAGKGFAGKRVKHFEGGRMPWTGSFSHIYVQLGWPPFNPTTWVSAEPTIPGAPLGYDVVDHGVPEAVTMPEMGANGPGPHRTGVALAAPGTAWAMPSGMNPRGAPQARLGGYAGTIVGREGYGSPASMGDWCQPYRPPEAGFLGVAPNGMNPAGGVMHPHIQAALAASEAAQATAHAVQAAHPPVPTTFWAKIDWHDIVAGVIQGVMVSATVAVMAPGLVKKLKEK